MSYGVASPERSSSQDLQISRLSSLCPATEGVNQDGEAPEERLGEAARRPGRSGGGTKRSGLRTNGPDVSTNDTDSRMDGWNRGTERLNSGTRR
jgi:hypothetical protein